MLGGTTVTSTGLTVVSGDLGVSPGSAVTGFPPGVLVGTLSTADPAAAQAQADLADAYDDAAGQAPDALISGDLGGLTLTPGVYAAASSIGLTGTLTLDAQDDPDAIWIFQVGSTLTTASASNMTLVNGAQSCNVFWQIGELGHPRYVFAPCRQHPGAGIDHGHHRCHDRRSRSGPQRRGHDGYERHRPRDLRRRP